MASWTRSTSTGHCGDLAPAVTWSQVHRWTCGVFAVALLLLTPAIGMNLLTGATPAPQLWSWAFLVVYTALTVVIVRFAVQGRNPQRLARVFVGVSLLALVSYPLVSTAPLGDGAQPWIFYVVPGAVGACAVAFERRMAFLGAAGFAIIRVVVLVAEGSPISVEELTLDALLIFVTGIVVFVPIEVLRSQARALMAARQEALSALTAAGAIRAAERETARWHALVHDDVLASLSVAAASRNAEDRVHVQELATTALERLRRDPGSGASTPDEFAARLAEAVKGAHPDVVVRVFRSEDAAEVGGEPAEAIIDATVEAVRNALTHAGEAVSGEVSVPVQVLLESVKTGIRVRITDQGIGFEPDRIPINRLGIVVSIRARMAAIGGMASVSSIRGFGTEVSLAWSTDSVRATEPEAS